MAGTARAVCEILRYLIIHWKCETGISRENLLEGQLTISIQGLNSKNQLNSLRCIITIASAGGICSSLSLKKFLKEIQSMLLRFSANLTWTSEKSKCFEDISGITPFQITFEVNEKPQSLMTDCLIIKHFLRKIIIVHHKIKFNFSVTVNEIFSTEIFRVENEPTLSLSSGIALVVDGQRYVSKSKINTTESHCSIIHPVLGQPVTLFIPEDVAGLDLLGELILTPAAALCPNPKVFSSQLNTISSISIFLYGPFGIPLMSNQEQSSTAIFRDISYFIDWKKYHLHMVPNLDLSLDKDVVLPDASYQVESSEGNDSQNKDPQGPTLLLFLFVDFHSGFPVQQTEIWGVHTLLTAHLSVILTESHSVVRDSIQLAVDQVLEQYHQTAKVHQKLQASLSVAVNSIMSVVTASTCSSFRKTCLQALQAVDTQEFGTKLHKIFHHSIQHRFPRYCSCDVGQQLIPEEKDPCQSTERAHADSSPRLLSGTTGHAGNKRLKKGGSPSPGLEGPCSARRPLQPSAASLPPSGGRARGVHSGALAPGGEDPARREAGEAGGAAAGPHPGPPPQDARWLQEVSNLAEWLRPPP